MEAITEADMIRFPRASSNHLSSILKFFFQVCDINSRALVVILAVVEVGVLGTDGGGGGSRG